MTRPQVTLWTQCAPFRQFVRRVVAVKSQQWIFLFRPFNTSRAQRAGGVTSACRPPSDTQCETTIHWIFHSEGANPRQSCSLCFANPGRCLHKQDPKKKEHRRGYIQATSSLKRGFSAICRVRRKIKKHSHSHPTFKTPESSFYFILFSQMQFPKFVQRQKNNNNNK